MFSLYPVSLIHTLLNHTFTMLYCRRNRKSVIYVAIKQISKRNTSFIHNERMYWDNS